MEDKTLATLLAVIGIVLLGISFYFNVSGVLEPLADTLKGEGLGALCSSEEECREFCSSSRGICGDYCKENPSNELCNKLGIARPIINNEGAYQESPPKPTSQAGADDKPVLKNLGFNIERWDKNTNLAGDLIFSRDIIFEDENLVSDWVFVEFGAQGQRKNDVSKNIEYWFFVAPGTDVLAPISGIVDVGFFEHTKDWGINFHTREDSNWIVSYEHVIDVKVKDGQLVQAGDIVAKAAPRINDKIAMTELAVWTGGQGIYKYCPFDFLDEELKPVYEEKLKMLVSDWEEFVGRDIYNEGAWVSPGCLVDRIKEA